MLVETYWKLTLSELVSNGFKKFEDTKLQAFMDEDPCQTQNQLAETLNVTHNQQPFPSVQKPCVYKKERWVSYELKERNHLRPRSTDDIDAKTQYLWEEGHTLYLVELVKETLEALCWEVLPHARQCQTTMTMMTLTSDDDNDDADTERRQRRRCRTMTRNDNDVDVRRRQR
ncbi:hypothetical protein ALC62_02171 [Cyphomyrmex costatus]|uniref:Uncharacterized protein n=1 Tax=Cyphomyrmex costatus TaxID=456900 RepID=A0A151INL4_9HYME|nr:hypothetical protein ALC62_02171 [Cyphomyrmex costatus]